MQDKFVEIKNAKRFRAAVGRIHHHNLKGVERMCLIFGDPGLGKTETALQYASGNGAIFLRMRKLMNARWLLRDLVRELGDYPARYIEGLFNQTVELLEKKKKTLILDEVDYFSNDSKVTETLRDLHDLTGTPMIFIGMSKADSRLKRYPHLYDRFVEVVKFLPLDREDVGLMVKELSNVSFSEDGIERIVELSEGKIRRVLSLIHRGEYIAQNAKLKSISGKDLR